MTRAKTVHVGFGFYAPSGMMCPLGCGMPFHVGAGDGGAQDANG